MYFVFRASNKIFQAILIVFGCLLPIARCDIDYNTINDDGSYSFRHTNDDIGSYYHSASASPDNIVRGRYGSRNPATGQVEEVVYTAGPRGFRAKGPKIHRKMDLAQYPIRPIGSSDDPLADPYDDPSYSFSYRDADASRSENSDSTGRIRGLYSYLDDIGERHSVRYAAGAGTGYEVSNAVPDNPISVGYSAPLYKSYPKARGKMSVQRGPNGSYKLIAAGPDHRRAESRGSDGLVRGTYSYLDDMGIQRTVEYIAGAGIGYRIVQNSVGPGTHVNPSVSDFRLTDTDFKLVNEYGRGASEGSGANDISHGGGSYGSSSSSRRIGNAASSDNNGRDYLSSGSGAGGGGGGGRSGSGGKYGNTNVLTNENVGSLSGSDIGSGGNGGGVKDGGVIRTNGRGSVSRIKTDRTSMSSRGSSSSRTGNASNRSGIRPTSSRNSLSNEERSRGNTATRNRDRERDRDRTSSGHDNNRGSSPSSTSRHSSTGGDLGGGYNYDPPSTANNYNFNDDDVGSLPPLITANRKILENDRERDWVERHRDSTVIKNTGKWYIGLPPGQSVRAHVQNIDLLPLGGRRVPSPSEALRQDEIAEMAASLENAHSYES